MKKEITEKEATKLLEHFDAGPRENRKYIYEFWKKLGYLKLQNKYSSFKDCLENELKDVSRAQAYKELAAAKIEVVLGEKYLIGDFSAYALSPLNKLSPSLVVKAWNLALEIAKSENKKAPSQKVVLEALDKLGLSKTSPQKITKPKKNKSEILCDKIIRTLNLDECEDLVEQLLLRLCCGILGEKVKHGVTTPLYMT